MAGLGKSWQVWGKSWQVGEKVGRFAKIVGRLGKKLAGKEKSWQVAAFKIRSRQVVKRCQIMKVRILQVITNWRYGVL